MKKDEKNFTENFNLTLTEEQEYVKAKKNVTLYNFRKELESDFLRFVKYMWPDFIEGRHHKDMAEMFEPEEAEVKQIHEAWANGIGDAATFIELITEEEEKQKGKKEFILGVD